MKHSNKKPVIANWKELNRRRVFSKYGRNIDEVIFRLPDGKEVDFLIQAAVETVCVLAITPENQVIVTKQYRPGPQEMLLEMPGGGVDQRDTSPETAAQRELLEETGYAGDLEFVTTAYDSAYSEMRRHCFVARNCIKAQEQSLDAEEFIEIEIISLKEFRDLLRSGKMTDIEVGYLCLDYAGLL